MQQKYEFVVTKIVRSQMDGTEKNLMNLRYHNVVSRYRYVNYSTFSFEYDVDSSKELKNYERIAKQIAKTNDSIRKKISRFENQ